MVLSKKIRVILIIVVTLLIIAGIMMFIPTLNLKQKGEMSIGIGEEYKEPGFYAGVWIFDRAKDVIIENNIDNTKIGIYEVTYTLNTKIRKIVKRRTVNVIDNKKPIIYLKGSSTVCPGRDYVEEGYEAIDNYDGEITGNVKIKQLDNEIIYSVTDSSNNTEQITRKLLYEDKTAPHISIFGEININVNVGDTYIEPGYVVTDNCDAGVNDNVVVTSDVNTNAVGKYTVNYISKDSSGNETIVTRTVNVIDPDVPPEIDGTGKNIYLTFDDGPSASITPSLLQILKEEGIKATFFVINHSDSLNYLIKQAYDEGHTVALHSYTHNYSYIYSSIQNYYDDLNGIRDKVKNITGVYSNIIRFPGGSSNTVSKRYSLGIMSILTQDVVEKGYIYFDWNISSEDAGSARTKEDVYNNVVSRLVYEDNIVLLHDFESNYKTLNAIRDIIKYGKRNGYTFKAIDESTKAVTHRVNN